MSDPHQWPYPGTKPRTVRQWVQQVKWGCLAGWRIARGDSVIENVIIDPDARGINAVSDDGVVMHLWINRVANPAPWRPAQPGYSDRHTYGDWHGQPFYWPPRG